MLGSLLKRVGTPLSRFSKITNPALAVSLNQTMATLTRDHINSNIREAQYAVRGPMVMRAIELQHQLKERPGTLPFEKVILCNIGNPQALEQKPITFYRQVASLCMYPDLLEHPAVNDIYPSDAVARAKEYLANTPGGFGAYSQSQGIDIIRQQVAKFVNNRDGADIPQCDMSSIFLSDGASASIQSLMSCMLEDKNDCILVPIPQYPLYSAGITLKNGSMEGYYLAETDRWETSQEKIVQAYDAAVANGKRVRGMVVINPGNPTGHCLDEDAMRGIVEFCSEKRLVLFADEVYQENVYAEDRKFVSFRRVVETTPSADQLELASFHSISKGFSGECGLRGGYMQLRGFSEDASAALYKLASVSLCPNTIGQLMVGLMCNPPQAGDPSYELYVNERDSILASLKRRAQWAQELSEVQGIECAAVEGALYAFPKITLPTGAVDTAHQQGVAPDFLYCMSLLEETGVCCVPGSGFHQEPGTFHFRIAILPPEHEFHAVCKKIRDHHLQFCQRYGGEICADEHPPVGS